MRSALITGITGQDGSYLAELLLEKGYRVHGLVRRVAMEDPEHQMSRIRHLLADVELHAASLESYPSLFRAVQKVKPDEFYHLAAQSFVSYSFEDEFSTLNANINGTHFALSATKELAPACRFYFAASSEMFGKVREVPQTEMTPFHPRSAYGISKCAGFDLTRNYREAYGLHATSGILYNHESPRRGFEFVTRKITSHAARIKLGLATELRLGNLDARRDWGHAKDYVEAMWLMVQQERPDDYVVATGRVHSVREFCRIAFEHVGLDYERYVVVDPRFFRPAEVDVLQGDASKVKAALGWTPRCPFEAMVREMADAGYSLDAWPQQVRLSRPGRMGEPNSTIVVDFTKMVSDGDLTQNYLIEEGDVMEIPFNPLAQFNYDVGRILSPFTGSVSLVTAPLNAAQTVGQTGRNGGR